MAAGDPSDPDLTLAQYVNSGKSLISVTGRSGILNMFQSGKFHHQRNTAILQPITL